MTADKTETANLYHQPVMVKEVVSLLNPVPRGTVVDATVGGGGHSLAILESRDDINILGLDHDPDALLAARKTLSRFEGRFQLLESNFSKIKELGHLGYLSKISGILFDLGVSAAQLASPDRGFSYHVDGPLDMRMNPKQQKSAMDVVNASDENILADLISLSGERRFARKIAKAIVASRPLTTTAELARVIAIAVPVVGRGRRKAHPARKVFQAIRIEVNAELKVLPMALKDAIDVLIPGGRCLVISYHSGEDRIVKQEFKNAVLGYCSCPTGLPCVCGAVGEVSLLTKKALVPSSFEIENNRKARSAKLRAVEKLEVISG